MEEYLGESKYDGNIRRVTLIKKVADMLEMKDGDHLSYWKIGNEIVIRKVKKEIADSPQVYDFIPMGTPLEESTMMIRASMDIAEYYVSTKKEPEGSQLAEVKEKVLSYFPKYLPQEKREEMLRISIELAKNLMSKTKIIVEDGTPED